MKSSHRIKSTKLLKLFFAVGLMWCGCGVVQAEQIRYRYVYVPIGSKTGNVIQSFNTINSSIQGVENSISLEGINDLRQVSGTFQECPPAGLIAPPPCNTYAFIYENGSARFLPNGGNRTSGGAINNKGIIGGYVFNGYNLHDFSMGYYPKFIIALYNKLSYAALLRDNALPLWIPPDLPSYGANSIEKTNIAAINNKNTILVKQQRAFFPLPLVYKGIESLALYKHDKLESIRLGKRINIISEFDSPLDLNDKGVVIGNEISAPSRGGFVHDTRTGKTILLKTLVKKGHTTAFAINNSNHVLGIISSKSGLQRIGVWDRTGKFHAYYNEKTHPVTPNLLFNNKNLIVYSGNPESAAQFNDLMPKPGVRLKIADLVVNPPTLPGGVPFISRIIDINNRGDMIGKNSEEDFMLLRLKN